MPVSNKIIPLLIYDPPTASQSSERNLLAAILERAFLDYLHVPVSEWGSVHKDAKRWIFSRTDRPWSFVWVCQYLDLDAGTLRNALRGLREEKGAMAPFSLPQLRLFLH